MSLNYSNVLWISHVVV